MSSARKLYSTFFVDDALYGVAVESVQEVLTTQPLTRVPLTSDVIGGLMNLRGNIILAINMRQRLGAKHRIPSETPMNFVLRTEDGPVSLVVDRIGDVVEVNDDAWEAAPPTLSAQQAELVKGVYKLDGRLLLELNSASALNISSAKSESSSSLDNQARRS